MQQNPITSINSNKTQRPVEPRHCWEESDPFKWIPQGLFYDMIDPTNETHPITDNVSGITIAQLISALESDVKSMGNYRNRFNQQNLATQNQVTALFDQYHY